MGTQILPLAHTHWHGHHVGLYWSVHDCLYIDPLTVAVDGLHHHYALRGCQQDVCQLKVWLSAILDDFYIGWTCKQHSVEVYIPRKSHH